MFTRISFGKGSGCDNMDYRYSHKRQKCSHMQERSPYRRCSRKKGENTEEEVGERERKWRRECGETPREREKEGSRRQGGRMLFSVIPSQ